MTALSLEPETRVRSGSTKVPTDWPLVCPECLRTLDAEQAVLRCARHGPFARAAGVWRFLTPERARRFDRFVREYETVRRAEGRGTDDPAYYRALPFEDLSGRHADQWRIRAASFRALIARVLGPLEHARGRPLAVVDVGAGNGWLSWRVAARGHRVAAVDLTDDARDGLGAHARYAEAGVTPFTPIQADFDRLPLADGCADLVVFNASLHYTPDVAATLAEAARVLRPDGRVVVMDSPTYGAAASGRRMVAERESEFSARFGFPSNAAASESWFTAERLHEAAAGAGLRWRTHRPWHGVAWALRPWSARVRRRREPSAFLLWAGEKAAPAPAPARREGWRAEVTRAALRLRHQVLGRRRRARGGVEVVAGRRLTIEPGVFSPRVFRTGAWLAEFAANGVVRPGDSVLDLGTGSGVGALAVAGIAARVVAVDVSVEAVRCARANARVNGLAGRVDVREGDLFEPLAAGERFDLVLFNPPFYRGVPGSASDAAWRSVDVPERFADGLAGRLTARGRALVVLSSDCDVDGWLRGSRERGLEVRLVARREFANEALLLYRIAPPARTRQTEGGA